MHSKHICPRLSITSSNAGATSCLLVFTLCCSLFIYYVASALYLLPLTLHQSASTKDLPWLPLLAEFLSRTTDPGVFISMTGQPVGSASGSEHIAGSPSLRSTRTLKASSQRPFFSQASSIPMCSGPHLHPEAGSRVHTDRSLIYQHISLLQPE